MQILDILLEYAFIVITFGQRSELLDQYCIIDDPALTTYSAFDNNSTLTTGDT